MDASRGEETADGMSAVGPLESEAEQADTDLLRAALAEGEPPLTYWESPDGLTFVGLGAVRIFEGGSLQTIRDRAARTFQALRYDGPEIARPRLFGGRSFDGRQPVDEPWTAFAPGYFVLPQHLIVADGKTVWHTRTTGGDDDGRDDSIGTSKAAPSSGAPRIVGRQPVPSRDAWMRTVTDVRDEINDGAFRKVVIAHSLDVELDRSPETASYVDRLRATNPGSYICLVKPSPDVMFVAATPERLVTREHNEIRSGALAGSIGRGDTTEDDDRLSTTLRTDAKERYEHRLVVEAIEDDLRALGADVEIQSRGISRFRSVQHLFTPVHATHEGRPHVLDLVEALHPTPAVGGAPRGPALEAIREREPFDRGWYASPIGWFDGAGDGTFAVGIRSAVIREHRARLFAGAGIVDESDPAAEWDEVQWKYRPILDTFEST